MEHKYVQLDYDQGELSKRHILQAEMCVLNSLKYFKNYRKHRKRELILKTNLRTTMRKMIISINNLIKEMPKVYEEEKEIKETVKILNRKDKVELELDDIKRRLAEIN